MHERFLPVRGPIRCVLPPECLKLGGKGLQEGHPFWLRIGDGLEGKVPGERHACHY